MEMLLFLFYLEESEGQRCVWQVLSKIARVTLPAVIVYSNFESRIQRPKPGWESSSKEFKKKNKWKETLLHPIF